MKLFSLILSLALGLTVLSCGPSPSNEPIALDAEKFEKRMNEETEKIVLDVRTPDEFASGHLPGAVLMNIKDPDFREKIHTLDTSKAIFVYCSAGVRSAKAASILNESGFKEVYQLDQGLNAWNEAEKELVK